MKQVLVLSKLTQVHINKNYFNYFLPALWKTGEINIIN